MSESTPRAGRAHTKNHRTRESVYAITSMNHAVACGRVAYLLGLRGAAVSVNTACSSALVAMHAARAELPGVMAAVNVLRALHVNDLRVLQSAVDALLVQMQEYTSDPKTDSKLGRVGSG